MPRKSPRTSSSSAGEGEAATATAAATATTSPAAKSTSATKRALTFALDSLPKRQADARRSLEVTNTMPTYKSTEEIPARFGEFGGRYIPETLMQAHEELERIYVQASQDPAFQEELEALGKDFVGRPTPLYLCKNLTKRMGGAQIWLKREDLAHTGSHKINNALGQGLIAKRIGKKRIIAETGAGQHGVATATVCALLGLQCVVYMGEEDMRRQALNVFRMRILGTEVKGVSSGTKTLKDAINEAMRDWVTNVETTHYIVGSAIGPHPFPTIVRDFQSVIGRETRAEFKKRVGRLPDVVVACVGGGSNSIGMFHPFVDAEEVELVGVEAGGSGVNTDKHCATLGAGRPGVLHGTRTYVLQDEDGQVSETHSISAGLDYPGVGPEHAFLKDSGRVKYVHCDDAEALKGLKLLSETEGIIPALESSHAVWVACERAKTMKEDQHIVINLSGRGDKDMYQVAEAMGVDLGGMKTGQPKVL